MYVHEAFLDLCNAARECAPNGRLLGFRPTEIGALIDRRGFKDSDGFLFDALLSLDRMWLADMNQEFDAAQQERERSIGEKGDARGRRRAFGEAMAGVE